MATVTKHIKHVPGILCLFSAPLLRPDGEPLEVLDIQREENEIRKSTANAGMAHLRFAFASVSQLIRGVEDGFNIIHLSGHDNHDFLLFEDETGGSQPLKKEYIKKVFARARGIELVVVSACHAENMAQLMLETGVKFVVVVRKEFPTLDFTANAFVGEFYSMLFKGRSVREAFEIARLAVEGNPMWDTIREIAREKREKEGKAIVEVERKFLLLPDSSPIGKEAGVTVSIEEKVSAGLDIDGLGKYKTNLPALQSRLFVGRSKEMHHVVNQVLTNRLVTIEGVGGIGKTALAIETGRWFHLRNHFKDGVFRIDLRNAEVADSVMRRIATELIFQFKEETEFFEAIKHRQCMFILDNAENLLWKKLTEFKRVIDQILETAGHVKLLVTSQKQIRGNLHEKESLFILSPLDSGSAVELFIERLKDSRAVLNDHNLSQLMNKIGNHPLSIVVMAGQVKEGCGVEDLLKKFKKQESLLVKGITDTDPAHWESLVKTLSSAYESLSGKEKTIFQLLSYFPSGIEKTGLDIITGESCDDLAVRLRDVALVEISNNSRLILLPPVRLFALSVLQDETEEHYGPRILEFLADFSRFIRQNYFSEQAVMYKMLFLMEEPNFRYGAQTIRQEAGGDGDFALQETIAKDLLILYDYNNWVNEAIDFGKRILKRFKELNFKTGEANTWKALGNFKVRKNELQKAETNYTQALGIYRELEDKPDEANTLKVLGDVRVQLGKPDEAEADYDKALEVFQEIGDKTGENNTWKALAMLQKKRES
ncbi:MAG: tetratricopeptide repeat protein [bacterium]|nr:tetratricopeptide repeat protein [bacterium]